MLAMAGLLVLPAVSAYATAIQVTTTADDNGENTQTCSLREALAFINRGMPSGGYGGCGTGSQTYDAVVELQTGQTYTLTRGPLEVTAAGQVQTTGIDTNNDPAMKTAALITTAQPQRLFTITSTQDSPYTFALSQVRLAGCAGSTSASCTDQGGLIYSQASLNLKNVRLTNGRATQGGALYLAGNAPQLNISQTEFSGNSATEGAALWLKQGYFNIDESLFQQNIAASGNELLHVDAAYTESLSQSIPGQMTNTTLSYNQARVLTVKAGMMLNNLTVIGNRAGLKFSSSMPNSQDTLLSGVGNSILVLNSEYDCAVDNGDRTALYASVYNTGCPQLKTGSATLTANTLGQSLANTMLGNSGIQQIIADSNSDGLCDTPPANGLLCPLQQNTRFFLSYHKPRLLMSYTQLDDSPIINQGLRADSDTYIQACTERDQRDFARSLCDLGAIEFTASSGTTEVNADIKYNAGPVRLDLADAIGDSELVTADYCNRYNGLFAPAGGSWQAGCFSYTSAPQKGSAYISDGRYLVYAAASSYHGTDSFKYRLVTTATRFSDSINDQTIALSSLINQEPVSGATSSSLSVGATGLPFLGGLLLLGVLRLGSRLKKRN